MFQPIGKMLLIKREPELSITKGGIIIPETVAEKPMQGEIVAIGDEVTKLKTGQRALYAKWAGTDVKLEDGNYLIVAEASVLGIVVPKRKDARKTKR